MGWSSWRSQKGQSSSPLRWDGSTPLLSAPSPRRPPHSSGLPDLSVAPMLQWFPHQTLLYRPARLAHLKVTNPPSVDHGSNIHRSLVAPLLRRRDQRADQCPLLIAQVARVTQLAPVIPKPVLQRPHLATPANRSGTS